jgi:catechol 2,3-dioxygenase-like lactoylglutathione lyase family enzyme
MTNHRLIAGVDVVVVPTDAFDEAIAFYGEVLHLPCIDRYGAVLGAEFQAGNLAWRHLRHLRLSAGDLHRPRRQPPRAPPPLRSTEAQA